MKNLKQNTLERTIQDNFRKEIASDTQFYYSRFPLKDFLIQPLTLSTTLEQIEGFLQLENLCRPYFNVVTEKQQVMIPCLFTVLSGLPKHKDMYWRKIEEYKTFPNVSFYNSFILQSMHKEGEPKENNNLYAHYHITGVMDLNESFEETDFSFEDFNINIPFFETKEEVFHWIDGILRDSSKAEQIFRSDFWNYNYLSHTNQLQWLKQILSFLVELQKYSNQTVEGSQYRETILSLFSLPKHMVSLWINYDLPYISPKILISPREREEISKKDVIIWLFLHHIGFDIILIDPLNVNPFSLFMKKEFLDIHYVGNTVVEERIKPLSKISTITAWWKSKVRGINVWE